MKQMDFEMLLEQMVCDERMTGGGEFL